jgi:hypothetical protein
VKQEFPTPKSITVPKKEKTYLIGGKSFTKSQIAAGAKKNNMTVADYLANFGLKNNMVPVKFDKDGFPVPLSII